MTHITPDEPIVENLSAASLSLRSARVDGTLVAGGLGEVWLCWGAQDGGTVSTGAWEHVVSVGLVDEGDTFSETVSGLATNATYWYRWYAENSAGSSWSAAENISGTPANPAGPWTPVSLQPLPRGWYDASDLDTITSAEGAVHAWADKSVHGNHLAQSAANRRPSTGSSTIGGLNVLDFSEDYIFTTSGLGADIYSVFMVKSNNVEITSTTPSMLLLSTAGDEVSTGDGYGNSTGASGMGNRVLAVLDETAANTYLRRQGVSSSVLESIPSGANLYTYALDTDWFIGFNGSDDLRDLTAGSPRSPMRFANQFSIGAGARRHPTAEFFYDGSVGEVILLEQVVSEDERHKIEGYLANKWGLTENLPEAHPYKSIAPAGRRISTLAPVNITDTQAELRASLSAEDSTYDIWLHWGTSDGGTNAGAWAQSVQVGSWGHTTEEMAHVVEGLSADTVHWYTFSANNADGVHWAEPSWQFRTLPAEDSPVALRVSSVRFEDGNIVLRTDPAWSDSSTIVIQMRTNLLSGDWTYAGEYMPDGEEGGWSWTNTSLPAVFFRFAVTNAFAEP